MVFHEQCFFDLQKPTPPWHKGMRVGLFSHAVVKVHEDRVVVTNIGSRAAASGLLCSGWRGWLPAFRSFVGNSIGHHNP